MRCGDGERSEDEGTLATPPSRAVAVRRVAGLALGTVFSAFCLWLVLRDVQLEEILRTLGGASLFYLGLAVLSYAAFIWAKAERWRWLFYPRQSQVRLSKLASVILIGQMANVWLFARAGELARAYLIGRIEQVNKAAALGTVVLEKALESLMIVLSLGLLALLVPLPSWLEKSSLLLSIALVGLLLALWMIANREEGRRSLGKGLSMALKRVPELIRANLSNWLAAASSSLEPLRCPGVTLRLLGWSFLAWAISTLTNDFTLRAVGIAAPWYVSLFLLVVFYVGAVIPASPGRFGLFHYTAVLSLQLFNIERGRALSFAILLHTIAYVLMGIAGAFCLWRESLSLRHKRSRGEISEVG